MLTIIKKALGLALIIIGVVGIFSGVKMLTIIKKALGLALIIIGVVGILKEAFVIGGLATVFGSYLAGLDDLD